MKKINEKQFLLIVIAWFVAIFVIMRLLGGACTSIFVEPSMENTLCLTKDSFSGIRALPIIGLFVPYNPWVSLMYFIAPIAGFVLAFFGIKWWVNYFETKEVLTFLFPIAMILILLVGYSINLSWYYGEFAALNSRNGVNVDLHFCFDNDNTVCQNTVNSLNAELQSQATTSSLTQLIPVNFWSELREGFFLTFIFGAIAGWVPLYAKRKIEAKSNK